MLTKLEMIHGQDWNQVWQQVLVQLRGGGDGQVRHPARVQILRQIMDHVEAQVSFQIRRPVWWESP